MTPKHIKIVPENRKAIAPYNFVELPEKIVQAEPLPNQSYFHTLSKHQVNGKTLEIKRYTGRLECSLITKSPIYTRCGWSPEDFAQYGEISFHELPDDIKQKRANFFTHPIHQTLMIPGSSLRGMLRTLVEIVSFSKLSRISGNQRLFFRAVATDPKVDSLAAEYKEFVNSAKIKAGYLRQKGEDWYICPAKIIKGVSFAWVKEDSVKLSNFIKFNDSNYCPQYLQVSYGELNVDKTDPAKRTFAQKVNTTETFPDFKGTLVTSGNMTLANEASPRCNHCLVFEVDSNAQQLKIDPKAVEHYCNALTDFQKEPPLSEYTGVLKDERPIFYSSPEQGNIVVFFGQSPNFRIPYSYEGNGHASTVLDFLPEALNNSSIIDIADAIFGYVGKNFLASKEKNYAGRIFVSDAVSETRNIDKSIKLKILGSPKVTTYPHYLVQPKETGADKSKLMHYASKPVLQTVIRGHKLYWHKGNISLKELREKDLDKLRKAKKQITEVKPIHSDTIFNFNINFENLSAVELGALLWILSLSDDKAKSLEIGKTDEQYYLSLGMGKPLGMGTVKVNYKLHLSDRSKRYKNLFVDNSAWDISETHKNLEEDKICEINTFIKEFESFMLDPEIGIHEIDYPEKNIATRLAEIPRIEMLLAMLRCDKFPDLKNTRYMTIEAKEYIKRLVLPNPFQVMKIPDKRKLVSMSEEKNNLSQVNQKEFNHEKTSKIQACQLDQVIEAEVLKKSGVCITYKILATNQKFTEKEHKIASLLDEGKIVKIKITALKEDGSIKNVKFFAL